MPSMTHFSLHSTDTDASLSHETIYNILSNRRRRYTVHALKHADQPVDVADLSKQITAWERDIPPDHVEYSDRRRVYNALKDTHLPLLAKHGLIEYDAAANTIMSTPALAALDIYVEARRNHAISWSEYYLGLTGLSVGLVVAVWLGVPGIAAIGPLGVSALTATAFLLSAIVHRFDTTRSRLGSTQQPPEIQNRS